MPVRSVLEIDVDDAQFRAFHALFERYQSALGRMPGQWQQVNRAQGQQRNTFVDIAAAMLAQNEMLRRSERQVENINRSLVSTGRVMTGLARSTREFVGHLQSATNTLLKWTGVTGVIGTLTGLLSAEGVSRLAGYGAATYRSSMGFAGPTSAGQVGAAGAYGGILSPHGALGQLTEMLTTAEGKRGLASLGIGPEMWGAGAGAILPIFLRRLQAKAQGTPEAVLGDVLGGQGLGGFTEQARILRRMSPQQLAQLEEIRVKNERELNSLTEAMLFKWVRLNATLDLAGTKIHYGFIEGLSRLEKPIERVTDAFSTAIASFLKSPEVGHWLDGLAASLEHLDMEKFATGIRDGAVGLVHFAEGVTAAIGGLVRLIAWVDQKTGLSSEGYSGDVKRGTVVGAGIGGWLGAILGSVVPGIGTGAGAIAGGAIGSGIGGWLGGSGSGGGKHWGAPIPPVAPRIGVAPLSNFADPAIRAAAGIISQAESKNRDINNFRYGEPGFTASGYYQILDSNWQKYGKMVGVDLAKYPRALGAPRGMQDDVFAAMFGAEGVTPWSSRAGGPMTPVKIAEMHAAMASAKQNVHSLNNFAVVAKGVHGIMREQPGSPSWMSDLIKGSFIRDPITGGSPDAVNQQQVAAMIRFKRDYAASRHAEQSVVVTSRPGIRVSVTNDTGGSAVTSAAQAQ